MDTISWTLERMGATACGRITYFTVYLLGGFAWNQTRFQHGGWRTNSRSVWICSGGPALSLILIQNIELDGMVLPWGSISWASHLSRCELLFNWMAGFGPICGMKAKGCGTCGLICTWDPSFIHEANGFGGDVQAKLRHFLTSGFVVEAGYSGIFLRADDGTDKVFRSNGTQGDELTC